MAKQYTPKVVSFSYAAQLLTGYAKGDFLTAKYNSDDQSLYVGAGGDTCFISNADKSGEVTLRLMRSSPSNDILSALYKSQRLQAVPKPIWGKDGSGTSVISSNEALIKKMPDLAFADEMSEVEWVFLVADLEVHIGGNL